MTRYYKTPDAKLTLVVEDDGGDFTLWFDGFPARVSGEAIRVFRDERKESTAVKEHLEDLFHDQVAIIIRKKDRVAIDAWIHEVPDERPPVDAPAPGESYELRSWTGAPLEFS